MYKIESVKAEIDSVIHEHPEISTVMLSFPDGLLDKFSTEIYFHLKKKNILPIMAGDPSYGACDLPVNQSVHFDFNVDAIFHFGHSTFAFPPPKTSVDIYYFTVEADVKIDWQLIHSKLNEYSWRTVGLLTTIQHTKVLEEAKEKFTNRINVKIYKEGQILGCNQDRAKKIADEVDAFIVIAGGNFHASPVVVATGKDTLRFDPFNKSFELFEEKYRNLYLKKRFAVINKAKSAKIWGVLVSLKSGQYPADGGRRLIQILEKNSKTAILIPMYRIDPNHLINFTDIDAFVINLCPRIATDDFVVFNKPILTAREMMVSLGILDWEVFTDFKKPSQLLILEENI